MDVNELQVRLLHAAKTKDQWKVVTSYPKKGEVCLEAITSTGATSFKIKIGDGTRPYCRNTGTPESPVWDFTSDQVLPYFGTTVVTDGTISVVSIGTYTEGSSIKKKLVFSPLSLASSTVEGVTTLSPVLGTNPYLEIREGTGIEFTVDETGTPKLLNINISSSYLNDTITSAINALDTPSPLNLAEWDSSTNTLSLYSLSEANGIVSKSSTAIATINLSGIAPVQDVQINNTSILSNGVADIAVDGTYDSSTNKMATESTVSSAIADLDVTGYGQATFDTTTSNQTTLTVKGIKEDDGKIAADSTQDVNIVMDGTYNASYNKVATQTTVSNAIVALDGTPTTVDATSSTDVITTVSETNGVVSSTKKTIVEGNKIDINVPTTGTSTGDIIISHEDIDTTAADVSSTITTDGSSVISEKELDVITGLKVDAQGHITHIDKDKSTNLVASDIKGSVSVTDDSAWIYRPTGGTISIGEDIAKVNGLEGNSCVWNQLVNFPTQTKNNVTLTNNGDGTYTVSGTPTSSADFFKTFGNIGIIPGHKYYVRFYSPTEKIYLWTSKSDVPRTSNSKAVTIISDTGGSVDIMVNPTFEGTSVKCYLYIIDLTLLGIDNLSTVAQVEEWLAQHVGNKPYYDYNAGEILSAKTLGFNTYGQNLLNPTTKQARLVTYTDETNSNKYTIKNIPDETTGTYTPDNTGISVDITSLIENDTFDITSYGNGILELSAVADNTYICIKWDGSKDDDIVPYEEHSYNFDVTKVYGRVSGVGEYVQCFPDGMRSAKDVKDTLTASEAVINTAAMDLGSLYYTTDQYSRLSAYLSIVPKRPSYGNPGNIISDRYSTNVGVTMLINIDKALALNDSDNRVFLKDSSISGSGTIPALNNSYIVYQRNIPITYTDLIYSEDGGQTGTPLKKVLLTMNVNDFGTEEQVLPDYVDDNPTSIPANVVIEYKSNFKEAVLETVDKVNSYKNPVRSANDTSQTTGKVAVYDSDSTVKSSTYEISNSTIDPEGTSNNTIIPTVNAVVDYVENVIDTEVPVKDITTTDDDTSGNGGIRVTNTGTTYDVHHADITQTDTTKQSTGEVIANVVTNVTVDSFGHIKGKEVISSDKLVAADIKAPVTVTDNTMWNHRVTGGTINIGEDTAKINPIKGNTLVWNQLVDTSASSITLISQHKYYTVVGETKSIQTGEGSAISVTGGTDIVVDLTKMFGAGNEPTTVEEFEAMFPNANYSYNEGELISLNPDGIKSVGFNQWDEEYERGRYDTITGEDTAQSNIIRSKHMLPVLPNMAYYANMYVVGGTAIWMFFYDAGNNLITGLQNIGISSSGNAHNVINCIFTTPSNCHYVKFYFRDDSSVCINISDPAKNGTYEPYKETTLDLSWIKSIKDNEDNQLFPNGLLRAGNVYDEVGEDYAIKRIGAYTFTGLETWSPVGNCYYCTVLNSFPAIVSGDTINCISDKLTATSSNNLYNGSILSGIAAHSTNIYIGSSDYSNIQSLIGLIIYYELETPITVTFDRKSLSYTVDDLGTETLLPEGIGSTTATPLSAPFYGQFEYKSNFKDTVLDLIDRVNNARNPVKGTTNTNQTVDKLAIYDSVETVKSSSYSPSNATIVEGATGNDIILPAVETIVNYVNSKLSSALTYKGTISEWTDLPTSGQSTGDMYIADTTFTEGSATYQAGDFFIWNGTSWDIVSGTTSVVNSNPTLSLDGGTYQVGTVDGISLQVTTPDLDCSSPTTSGTSLEYIDTVSQTNGLLSATKKSIPTASDSQSGVVVLSTGIENTTTEDSKVPTAYDTLTNLNNRDVASGTITDNIATLSKRMLDEDSTSPTYESWINKTFYPTTKFNAINDFSTGFATNYPDLAKIENITTDGDSSTTPVTLPNTGFLKRTYNSTTGVIDWELTDDTGKMTWLKAITSGTNYSYTPLLDSSSNDTEVGSYIHNYPGVTSIDLATLNSENKGFRIDVPILTSPSATSGKVLKGITSSLPAWDRVSLEELNEINAITISSATSTVKEGLLRRTKVSENSNEYEWSFDDTDIISSITTVYNNGNEVSDSTTNAGIQINGSTLKKVPFSAIVNDNSTGNSAVVIILNGNFS